VPHYWIGVASLDHVRKGVEGGFCQLCHGKSGPIRRLAAGDWIAYYSPRSEMGTGTPIRAFTALGRIKQGGPYEVDLGQGFVPTRRNVSFLKVTPAAIEPLIDRLEFIRNKTNWAYHFRFGIVSISRTDCELIAHALGVGQLPQ
jgi:hypothetical protein